MSVRERRGYLREGSGALKSRTRRAFIDPVHHEVIDTTAFLNQVLTAILAAPVPPRIPLHRGISIDPYIVQNANTQLMTNLPPNCVPSKRLPFSYIEWLRRDGSRIGLHEYLDANNPKSRDTGNPGSQRPRTPTRDKRPRQTSIQ